MAKVPDRLRFEILKRDGFRCAYCGAGSVEVQLQVDHIVAIANGGGNEPENLVTSCDRCNRGKSDIPLEAVRLRRGVEAPRKQAVMEIEQRPAAPELTREEMDVLFADFSKQIKPPSPNESG